MLYHYNECGKRKDGRTTGMSSRAVVFCLCFVETEIVMTCWACRSSNKMFFHPDINDNGKIKGRNINIL